MKETPAVFVSSTGLDLAEYRQAALEVCRGLEMTVVAMEDFEAMGAGATEGSLAKLEEADVYVGIFAHRYGFVEEGYEKSVTELEFEGAGERGLDRLCFVVDPSLAWPVDFVDSDRSRIDDFKQRLDQRLIRAQFTTVDAFKLELHRALEAWWKREKRKELGEGAAGTAATGLDFLHQLPPPPADFTGRVEELTELRERVEAGKGLTLCGLRGMGGLGKTALALKLAQEVAGRYPDAQLLLDLRGSRPEPERRRPEEVMAQVVQAFHPQARVPEGEALAAAYRGALHGKRALLLFDDAASVEQVRPLLPPASCLALVTSRRWFALPGQHEVNLDVLTAEAARALLAALAPRLEPEEAERLAELCGRLPLVLRLAGSALGQRVDLSPAEYVRRLEDAGARLGLADGEVGVEASLLSSWELLEAADQGRLARLSVFPAPFDRAAAAAVWGEEDEAASKGLGRLLRASLVIWDQEAERYRLHDLVRDFAAARLGGEEDEAAGRGHAEHYLGVLWATDRLYKQGGEGVLAGLALFDRERPHFETGFAWAAVQAAEGARAAELASGYPDAGANCLALRQHPRERIDWLETALTASRRLGDQQTEGQHLGNLGIAYRRLGDARKAIAYHEQALEISREIGDRQGEGQALGNLGNAHTDLGDSREALGYYEQVLEITREIGDRRGEGAALGNLGIAYRRLGDPRKAIGYY